MEKSFCFSTKRLPFAACRFHVKMKQQCLDQTQKRYISELSFDDLFEAGNLLNAESALNQVTIHNFNLTIDWKLK